MDRKREVNQFFEAMLERAAAEYASTGEGRLLEEKRERMEEQCCAMFTQEELAFVEECFALLAGLAGRRERYLYHRGLLDGAALLPALQHLT